jgi:hypothetical protein
LARALDEETVREKLRLGLFLPAGATPICGTVKVKPEPDDPGEDGYSQDEKATFIFLAWIDDRPYA